LSSEGAFGSQSANAGQSPSVASLAFDEANSTTRELRSRIGALRDDSKVELAG